MTKLVMINQSTGSMAIQECETLAGAFDALLTIIQVARAADPSIVTISAISRIRDQALLNFARWLRSGRFDDESEKIFIALCEHAERKNIPAGPELRAAYAAMDAFDQAIKEGGDHWEAFDAKFDEFKTLLCS